MVDSGDSHKEDIIEANIKVGEDDAVPINLYVMQAENMAWTLLLSTFDDGISFDNTPPIFGEGRAGIRTDFMDVEFEDFRLEDIQP